jgi:hypothetical protein
VRNCGQRFLFLHVTGSCLIDDVGAFPFLVCVIDFVSDFAWTDHERAGATLSRGKRGDGRRGLQGQTDKVRQNFFRTKCCFTFVLFSCIYSRRFSFAPFHLHVYILFLSFTFASGILSYFFIFIRTLPPPTITMGAVSHEAADGSTKCLSHQKLSIFYSF